MTTNIYLARLFAEEREREIVRYAESRRRRVGTVGEREHAWITWLRGHRPRWVTQATGGAA
jgi:hypothetical protein